MSDVSSGLSARLPLVPARPFQPPVLGFVPGATVPMEMMYFNASSTLMSSSITSSRLSITK